MSQTDEKPDGGATSSTPRWVKFFGVIVLVVILLFVIILLTNPGAHGPGRHTWSSEPRHHTPLIEHGVQ